MIEVFKTDNMIKKVIIALLFVIIFNFLFINWGSNIVFAAKAEGEVLTDEEIMEIEGGGKILIPVHEFVLFLADAVLELMQNNFISSQPVTIVATAEETKELNGWAIFGIVLGAVVFVGACIVTCRSCCYGCWCSIFSGPCSCYVCCGDGWWKLSWWNCCNAEVHLLEWLGVQMI